MVMVVILSCVQVIKFAFQRSCMLFLDFNNYLVYFAGLALQRLSLDNECTIIFFTCFIIKRLNWHVRGVGNSSMKLPLHVWRDRKSVV